MALDLTDLEDGDINWGTPLRVILNDLDTRTIAATADAAAAQSTGDDAQTDATQALADAAAAQSTADDALALAASGAITGVGVTVSGAIKVATTSTPAGMAAGDLIIVVP